MLKWIKRLFLIVLLVIALVVGIIFTAENDATISLMLFGYTMPELSIGLWIVIVLLCGALIGLLLSFLPLLFSRHSVASRDRKIKQLEKELDKLRVSGVKG